MKTGRLAQAVLIFLAIFCCRPAISAGGEGRESGTAAQAGLAGEWQEKSRLFCRLPLPEVVWSVQPDDPIRELRLDLRRAWFSVTHHPIETRVDDAGRMELDESHKRIVFNGQLSGQRFEAGYALQGDELRMEGAALTRSGSAIEISRCDYWRARGKPKEAGRDCRQPVLLQACGHVWSRVPTEQSVSDKE